MARRSPVVVSSSSSFEEHASASPPSPEQAAATAPPPPVAPVVAAAFGNDDDSSRHSHNNVNKTKTKKAKAKVTTIVVHPPCHAPPYIRCESLEPFLAGGDPMTTSIAAAASESNKNEEQQQQQLNLNLGHSRLSPDKNPRLLWMINKFLSSVLVEWWEHVFYKVWQHAVPLALKRRLVFGAWKIYLPLHKLLLGRRTAIHRDASLEYHALSTLLYWGRFFPVSVSRMRFALSQLHVWMPPTTRMTAARVTHIHKVQQPQVEVDAVMPLLSSTSSTANNTVKGIFLHRHSSDDPAAAAAVTTTDCTIFWIYGGAFLAGDAPGNAAIADWVGHATNMDVFIPTIRLAPEADMDEILWDVCLAYRWLCRRLQRQQGSAGQKPQSSPRIQLLGISSGGALCTRLMQLIAEHERGEDIVPAILKPLLACNDMKMPCGAVLLGPFVDYTPAKGSLLECAKHDLVVHDRVLESGLPFLETHIPPGKRTEYSPALRNCHGLPPLCVVLSMHEAVFDMTVTLINRARRDGVPVTVGCWKYMCHVFSFLQAFIPEGRVSMEFLVEWMRQRNAQCDEQEKDDETAAPA